MISTEIRYFFPSESASDVLKELIDRLSLEKEEERTDEYYLQQQSATCGIKWRQGNLEVKSLINQDEKTGLNHWEKISFDLPAAPEGYRCAVRKLRWLAYFDHSFHKVNPSESPHCQVEVSRVLMQNRAFWSICLEAGNAENQPRQALLLSVLKGLEADFPRLAELTSGISPQSYPEILLGLNR